MKKTILSFSILSLALLVGTFAVVGEAASGRQGQITGVVADGQGAPLKDALITIIETGTGQKYMTKSTAAGDFALLNLPPGTYDLIIELAGFKKFEKIGIRLEEGKTITLKAVLSPASEDEVLAEENLRMAQVAARTKGGVSGGVMGGVRRQAPPPPPGYRDFNTEEYGRIYENVYKDALNNPLSTFSIDVDTASYANMRRFLKMNRLPPKDAVRIEELINYFRYDYPLPKGKTPFSIYTEMSASPWNAAHRLVHIGLQGRMLDAEELPPSNLVFLIDVSGSMGSPEKLPLLKSAFKLLVKELSPKDRVALVVYAGAAGLVQPSTAGDRKETLEIAIDQLRAGGSTAGGAGIQLAYKVAAENFIKGGNNRVILATDGDFNVGMSSSGDLVRMIEEKRKQGIFLTILGFGMGNYKDSRMEQLADKGNGNYYYIDGLLEAKKVFVDDMRGTLFTIAKDVKIQVEFNPAKVKAYRLLGYEDRLLNKEDFADDTKDAGELGSGHTVTALYEIIPYGSKEDVPGVDELKYQETKISPEAFKSKEMMTIKLRYKEPDGETSKLISQPLLESSVNPAKTSENFRFSAAVAAFGMILRGSEFKGDATLETVLDAARKSRGEDAFGYRAEFISLVELATLLEELKK
jgi:Ca-activated chloride channel family protein